MKCEREIGTVTKGFGLLFVRVWGLQEIFLGIAQKVDWVSCQQCGPVPTPLMVDPEMFGATAKNIREFIDMRNPDLKEFREEFPLTPAIRGILKEELEIFFS